jgi:hypothetical protein
LPPLSCKTVPKGRKKDNEERAYTDDITFMPLLDCMKCRFDAYDRPFIAEMLKFIVPTKR